ncbi:hypothetical protein BDD30_1450 [Photorhabdus asymbiotica]|uniref:Uncharacterized protein n=1 Tax=Photorhabdus asymbiotica TaxID=291112 RepID=A0ABX9SMX4_9GAMM|nr:hypothetical protein BDD30_1450 [Photorhabdus asymbiotica]
MGFPIRNTPLRIRLYPSSFKLLLCWLLSLTPVTELSIPVIFQVASLLAALTHPGHRVIYAPGDSFTCCRAATRNLLGIDISIYWAKN